MRERTWSLSRCRTTETVTLSRIALVGRIPAVYDQRYNCHNLRDGVDRPSNSRIAFVTCVNSMWKEHVLWQISFVLWVMACALCANDWTDLCNCKDSWIVFWFLIGLLTASTNARSVADVLFNWRVWLCESRPVVWFLPETKGGQTTLGYNPPFSAAAGQNPAGIFCWKLTLTRTPDLIRPTRRVVTPTDPWTAANKGGYNLRGVCPGFWSDTAGDNRRQQNRI